MTTLLHIIAALSLLCAIFSTLFAIRLILESATRGIVNSYPVWMIVASVLWMVFYLLR